MSEEPRFIVAEVSKNWERGLPAGPAMSPGPDLLSTRFEMIVNANFERGYKLHSFAVDRKRQGFSLNETIVAVFEKIDHGPEATTKIGPIKAPCTPAAGPSVSTRSAAGRSGASSSPAP